MSSLRARRAALGFKGYDDFHAALHAARLAARDGLGYRWDLSPHCIWARVPAAWSRCKVFGRVATAPRDQKFPPACYWPGGVWPQGPVYAEPARAERVLALAA